MLAWTFLLGTDTLGLSVTIVYLDYPSMGTYSSKFLEDEINNEYITIIIMSISAGLGSAVRPLDRPSLLPIVIQKVSGLGLGLSPVHWTVVATQLAMIEDCQILNTQPTLFKLLLFPS
jgi:hypothetical protein